MTLYNVIFTALSPIVVGIFDRDVSREQALRFPGLYMQSGSRRREAQALAQPASQPLGRWAPRPLDPVRRGAARPAPAADTPAFPRARPPACPPSPQASRTSASTCALSAPGWATRCCRWRC
jgi:hypothetical protein